MVIGFFNYAYFTIKQEEKDMADPKKNPKTGKWTIIIRYKNPITNDWETKQYTCDTKKRM